MTNYSYPPPASGGSGIETLTLTQTFTYPDTIAVSTLPGLYAQEDPGTVVTLTEVRHAVGAGTSATWTLRANGSPLTGLTGIVSTTAAATTDPTDIPITSDDYIDLDITAISGTPEDLRVTLVFSVTSA